MEQEFLMDGVTEGTAMTVQLPRLRRLWQGKTEKQEKQAAPSAKRQTGAAYLVCAVPQNDFHGGNLVLGGEIPL